MTGMLRTAGIAAAVLLGLAGAAVLLFLLLTPDAGPAPDLRVEATPERIERGRYLANHVTVCLDCHSTRDWSYFSGPPVPGTEGKGGDEFTEAMGFPGTIRASNITPAGIGSMTDGELFRAITGGIGRDGRALFPLMPYPAYNTLADEDLTAIIAYIRTLRPIDNAVRPSEIAFPVNLLIRLGPSPHRAVAPPDRSGAYGYGKYLATAADCAGCHTPQEGGKPMEGMQFAGGFAVPFPQGIVRSANITPDEETGIGLWSREYFISRFKEHAAPGKRRVPADSVGYYSFMPWTMYAGMTEEDLGAIYTYLRNVPPVKHVVERFTPHSPAAASR